MVEFMNDSIIESRPQPNSMLAWLETPAGRYLQAWEEAKFAKAVADMFGYHALQLGLPQMNTLGANRMPNRWIAVSALTEEPTYFDMPPQLVCDTAMLPFAEASLDLICLPHALELSQDPHATLAEVERVLVPEGRVVICGFNPSSLWGWRQARAHWHARWGSHELFLPRAGEMIAYKRLRDWLRLLSFEVESASFGCYRPAFQSAAWLQRMRWMDSVGARWWPILGSAYFLVAAKRVRGMRIMPALRKRIAHSATAPVPLAPRAGHTHSMEDSGS
jgi:SAM-dependent methyltransferase